MAIGTRSTQIRLIKIKQMECLSMDQIVFTVTQ